VREEWEGPGRSKGVRRGGRGGRIEGVRRGGRGGRGGRIEGVRRGGREGGLKERGCDITPACSNIITAG